MLEKGSGLFEIIVLNISQISPQRYDLCIQQGYISNWSKTLGIPLSLDSQVSAVWGVRVIFMCWSLHRSILLRSTGLWSECKHSQQRGWMFPELLENICNWCNIVELAWDDVKRWKKCAKFSYILRKKQSVVQQQQQPGLVFICSSLLDSYLKICPFICLFRFSVNFVPPWWG